MIKLITKRTIIRDHVMDDLQTHHELFSDKKIMYYLRDISTDTIDESKESLMKAMEETGKPARRLYFLRIDEKNVGEHIGEIGYTVTDVTPVGKFVGAGYFIKQKYWGMGYTTEGKLKDRVEYRLLKTEWKASS